jgi:hypothetical protein
VRAQLRDVVLPAVDAQDVAPAGGEELGQPADPAAHVDHRPALDREPERGQVLQPRVGDLAVERLVEERDVAAGPVGAKEPCGESVHDAGA